MLTATMRRQLGIPDTWRVIVPPPKPKRPRTRKSGSVIIYHLPKIA